MHAYAVTAEGSAITDIQLPTPRPAGNEVLLKVERSGVCHTDTHLRQGGYDLGSRGRLRLADRGISYPLVMGHEVVGSVEQVGEDVTGTAPGDLRLVYPWIGCGDCRQCAANRDNYCAAGRNIGVARYGGYADHVLVPDEKYLVDIAGLDPSWAATLACSGLTAFAAVRKVDLSDPDDPVVVIGAGGVGLTAVATLRALGHRAICAVDLSEQNLRIATELGASVTVPGSSDALGKEIVRTVGEPVAAVIDFVNNSATATAGYQAVRKGGELVQVGLFGGELIAPTALTALRMITIRGSFVGTPGDLHDLVGLAKRGVLPRIPITEVPFAAESVQQALDQLEQGGVSGRIVLRAGS